MRLIPIHLAIVNCRNAVLIAGRRCRCRASRPSNYASLFRSGKPRTVMYAMDAEGRRRWGCVNKDGAIATGRLHTTELCGQVIERWFLDIQEEPTG
jgi:hypothetical protein